MYRRRKVSRHDIKSSAQARIRALGHCSGLGHCSPAMHENIQVHPSKSICHILAESHIHFPTCFANSS